MNMTPEALFVGGVGSVVAALVLLILAVKRFRRRHAPVGEEQAKGTEKIPGRGFVRIGAVLKSSDEKANLQLRNRLVQAGLYGRDAVDLYLSVRMTVMISALLVFILLSQTVESFIGAVFLLMIVACLSVLGPSIWLDMRATKRKVEVSRRLPGTLDLLVTCLDAGLNLEQALTRVATESRFGDDLLSRELRITLEEIRAGLSTAAAFNRLATRLGHEEVQNLSALIAQASNLGANLADALRAHSQNIRKHRIVFLEEQAGKANAKLTLPLTTCLLPAVMILLLGPAVVMMMKSF